MPKQNITFSGFKINSRDMKIPLTKKEVLWLTFQTLRNNPNSPDYQNYNIHPTRS